MFKNILISATLAASLFAGDYVVDKAHSSVGFSVKHLAVSTVKGDFKTYDGNFSFDEKTKTITKLEGIATIASIDTGNDKRDEHLKSSDFFDATKFPKMSFVMTKFIAGKQPKVEGKLTIRDITKTVVFDADIGGTATDPWGTKKAGLSLSGKINRKDFGLTWNKVLETGGLAVGDEVKITLDIEGNAK